MGSTLTHTGLASVAKYIGVFSSRLENILFFNINGSGLGHMNRCLSYARAVEPRLKPVFFSLAAAVETIESFGFEAEYFVSPYWSDTTSYAWNSELAVRFGMVLEQVKPAVSKEEQESFLNLLSQQRTRGFKLFWTVHNYVSHDCADRESEIRFRQRLYELMDKVFVHHALAVELLDWLTDSSKVSDCEHGLYDAVTIDKSAARQALGLSDDDFVISTVGRVKPYKGLPKLLPNILKALDHHPQLKFALLGKIDDVAVKVWIAANPHDRFIVKDEYVDHEQLETWMSATDVGLLSYENILTSGAMFHWFAADKPVLAPKKGILPAYVVNGWNGFTYQTEDDLLSLIDQLFSSDQSIVAGMTANAKTCRSKLQWCRVH